jgi:hypothetical protein
MTDTTTSSAQTVADALWSVADELHMTAFDMSSGAASAVFRGCGDKLRAASYRAHAWRAAEQGASPDWYMVCAAKYDAWAAGCFARVTS